MTNLRPAELEAIANVLLSVGEPVAGPLRSSPILGGRSNLTYRLDDGKCRWVLRMPPLAGRTPSAHDVAREFRVTSSLQHTRVPVARPVALCEDSSLIGVPFAVAAFVEGRTIQSRQQLSAVGDDHLEQLMAVLVKTLADLHRVDHLAAGLGDLGRAEGYAVRQLRRWTGQWEVVGPPALDRTAVELNRRLVARVRPQRATAIVHGDFRLDNTLVELSGSPVLTAVLDWELCTIGDPVADVAMTCAYRHTAFDLIVGAPSAWTSARLGSTDDLATAYQQAGGVELTEWEFHLALAYFKVAVIAAGIDHRFRMGSGVGPGFDSAGLAVEPYLQAGLACLDGA